MANYYKIDETAVRRANEMMGFSNYSEGRVTREYQQMVDGTAALAARQKERVDARYHEKIDCYLALYVRKLAENLNEGYSIDARCPSIMISGGSNFPASKKERQIEARRKNAEEFSHIQDLLNKIRSIGTGGISSDDPDALEKLRDKLTSLENMQQTMKSVNAYYRKHKTLDGCPRISSETVREIEDQWARGWYSGVPFLSYELSNNNANMRHIRERIAELKKRQADDAPQGWEFDGGKVVINTEINRIQILFDGKPEADIRGDLKSNGFRWAPSQKAWQRQLTDNALYAAKHINAIAPVVTAEEDTNEETDYSEGV